MAKYQYSELAAGDLEGIAEYTFLNFGEKQARAYRVSIDHAAATVANFPSLGRPYETKSGTLYFKYNVGEHALFYRQVGSDILIIRVLHLVMDFDRHLETR
ncbi:MAG: type II toxin-antitoxin system RelE/ParE family toxin [Pseudomonadota bacterium]